MIIDCHCHAGPGDGLTAPWDTTASLDKYLARASRAGIDRTVLFAAFHSDYAVANHEVARVVGARPDRFFGFCFVNSVADRGRIRALVRTSVEQYGFVGIKVHRFHGDITREVCDVARDFDLPVLYDVMGKVSVVEMLATAFPDVRFIIPHLGSFVDDWRANLGLIDHLVRHPNVHTDSSAVQRFDFLEQAVQRAGAHKLLFGSDGPWIHPGVELAKIRELRLAPADEALVLSGNLLRLIGERGRARVRKPVAAAPHLPVIPRPRVTAIPPRPVTPWMRTQSTQLL
ncbi:MAG: amidohydrolase [Gemmatimonadetes bacterium]|nr:amidohydrolase [Gemmatimonadota bacterium]